MHRSHIKEHPYVEKSSDALAEVEHLAQDRINRLRIAIVERGGDMLASTADLDKLINGLAVQFLNELDDARALSILALISIAKRRQNKAARAVVLNLTRWFGKAPPPLRILSSDDERRAVIKSLWNLKRQWIPQYALAVAMDKQLSKAVRNEALRWAIKGSVTHEDLVSAINSILTGTGVGDVEVASEILSLVLRAVKSADHATGVGFAGHFEALCLTVANASASANSREKYKKLSRQSLLGLAEIFSSAEPAVLFDMSVLRGIVRVLSLEPMNRRLLDKSSSVIIRRMWSIGRTRAAAPDGSALCEIREKLIYASTVLPIAEVAQKYWPDDDKSEEQLLGKNGPSGSLEEARPTPTVLEKLAALLIATERMTWQNAQTEDFQDFSAMTKGVARAAGVETFGTVGEVVAYDPLEHFLDAERGSVQTTVSVRVSGARLIREDGSHRILIRAVVSPHS